MRISDPLALRVLNFKNAVAILSSLPYVEGAIVDVNKITSVKIIKVIKIDNLPEDEKRKALETALPYSGHRTVEDWLSMYKTIKKGEPKYIVIMAKPSLASRLRGETSGV